MRLLSKDAFEKQLRDAGLKPTEATSATGKIWRCPDGQVVLVPNPREDRIPDSVVEVVLREVGLLYRSH